MRILRSKRHSVLSVWAIVMALPLLTGAPARAQMPGGMREMMQRMMGDVLPPGIDPKLLPEPDSRGCAPFAPRTPACPSPKPSA